MIKITFLGTCSGTEPMPNMHHCSVVFEIADKYYWFDAGENCSHAAYTAGFDVTRIRAIFVSHLHIDHIGGLANLIFTVNKVANMYGNKHINNGAYDIFTPSNTAFNSIKLLAQSFREPTKKDVMIFEHEVSDGVIFDDGAVKVTALHNTHLKEDGLCGWHSYSYLIESSGKRIVFSGDVGAPSELDSLIGDGCDVLIMETGHHSVSSVLEYAKSKNIKKLLFNHHGREILRDRDAALALISASGVDANICYDMMTFEVK